jgi:hypothetical protein
MKLYKFFVIIGMLIPMVFFSSCKMGPEPCQEYIVDGLMHTSWYCRDKKAQLIFDLQEVHVIGADSETVNGHYTVKKVHYLDGAGQYTMFFKNAQSSEDVIVYRYVGV